MYEAEFEAQIRSGLEQTMTGWNFSWLNERTREEPLPWDFRAEVLARMGGVQALLDIGTGGGEFFSSLFLPPYSQPVPPSTWAVEGYPPNVPVARAKLAPFGIRVIDVSGQGEQPRLPFEDATFDLIIDRHEGWPAPDLFRALKPCGCYITQQVGGDNALELNQYLSGEPPLYGSYNLAGAKRELEEAGFRILDAREARPTWDFLDVAGVVFYLKVIPWQMPETSLEAYYDRLYAMYQHIQQHGCFSVHEHRLLLTAQKPD